jgi:hypothetical protein
LKIEPKFPAMLRSSLISFGLLAMGAMASGVVLAADKSGYSIAHPTPVDQLRELSTDRPDQTENPYTVDAGHFQVELDVVNYTYDRDRSGGDDVRIKALTLAPLNLKLGLTNRVDLQLMVDPYASVKVEDRMAGITGKVSGFGDITTRLKINFWGNDGGKTAFALMPFVKWPLSASNIRNGETEGGIIFVLGYELPSGWSSAVMTELDFVSNGTGGRDTEWLNSITFSHDLTKRLGGYVEFVALTGSAPRFKWQGQFDVGLTYALAENTQLDLGCNFGVTPSAPDYQPFVGLSRRF